jgi:hypothetical protein
VAAVQPGGRGEHVGLVGSMASGSIVCPDRAVLLLLEYRLSRRRDGLPVPSSDHDVLFAVRWNGQGWSGEVMAEPAANSIALIGGISCPSGAWCVAVGGTTAAARPGDYVPLVERWNGAAWSVDPVPTPAGRGLSSRFSSVSCTSPTACTAVGESIARSSKRPTTPLIERCNGTTWSIQHAASGTFAGVSCTSSHDRTAVGDVANRTLAEAWNGRRCSLEPDPHPRAFGGADGVNQLSGVSRTSPDACMAVGYSSWGTVNPARITLAARWNGSRWAIQPSANPLDLDEFKSVWSASRSSCVAVGDYSNRAGTASLPLVEQWHRDHWSALPTPRRLSTGRAADSTLVSVECFARGSCLAVGDAEGGPFAVQFRAG